MSTSSPLLSTWRGWIALAAIVAVPLLYSGFYLGAFWNPYGHMRNMTAAVVNHDGLGGSRVVRQLRHVSRITLVSRAGALDRLSRGAVSAVITIPAGYSAAMQAGQVRPLTFTVDAANNYLQDLLWTRQIQAIEWRMAEHDGTLGLHRAGQGGRSLEQAARKESRGLAQMRAESATLAKDAAGAAAEVQGLARTNPGLSTLAAKVSSLAHGMAQLSTGITSAQGGSQKIQQGSAKLAAGLSGPVPARAFGRVITLHPVASYGQGLAPYFLSLSLWVGSLVATVVIPGGAKKGLGQRQRVSLGLGLAQSMVLGAGILLLLPLTLSHGWAFFATLALTAGSWWAVIRLLREKLGDAGRVIAIALLVIQLAGSGGTYPMVLSSGFFHAIHPWLPMTWAVNLLRYSLSSGLGPAAMDNTLRLAGLLAGCWLLTRFVPGHARFETPPLEPS